MPPLLFGGIMNHEEEYWLKAREQSARFAGEQRRKEQEDFQKAANELRRIVATSHQIKGREHLTVMIEQAIGYFLYKNQT